MNIAAIRSYAQQWQTGITKHRGNREIGEVRGEDIGHIHDQAPVGRLGGDGQRRQGWRQRELLQRQARPRDLLVRGGLVTWLAGFGCTLLERLAQVIDENGFAHPLKLDHAGANVQQGQNGHKIGRHLGQLGIPEELAAQQVGWYLQVPLPTHLVDIDHPFLSGGAGQ